MKDAFNLVAFKRDVKVAAEKRGMSHYELAELLKLAHMTAYRMITAHTDGVPSLNNFAKACIALDLHLENYLALPRKNEKKIVKKSKTADPGFDVARFRNDVHILRVMNRMTQSDLASKIGVTRQALNKMENTGYGINVEIAYRLAYELNIQDLNNYLIQ